MMMMMMINAGCCLCVFQWVHRSLQRSDGCTRGTRVMLTRTQLQWYRPARLGQSTFAKSLLTNCV